MTYPRNSYRMIKPFQKTSVLLRWQTPHTRLSVPSFALRLFSSETALAAKGRESGGARVLYIDYIVKGVVGLLSAYPKSEKENITENEKKVLRNMAEQIAKNLEGQR